MKLCPVCFACDGVNTPLLEGEMLCEKHLFTPLDTLGEYEGPRVEHFEGSRIE